MSHLAFIAAGLAVLGGGAGENAAARGPSASQATRAVAALERECQSGRASACTALGDAYRDGGEYTRAARVYQQACDSGHSEGCGALASAYANGVGVVKDSTRAAALFKQACDGGVMTACVDLGVLYDQGTGVPKDLKRAIALYELGCQKGATGGCFNRAGLFREEGNFGKAEALFRKACDGGNKEACEAVLETVNARLRYERQMRELMPKPSEPKRGEPKEVCARHILIKVGSSPGEPSSQAEADARNKAEAILFSLNVMKNDFAQLAREFSEDASTAKGGGDLGCFARGVLVREFEDVAFALKVGETSEVVRTPFGFHVVQRVAKQVER